MGELRKLLHIDIRDVTAGRRENPAIYYEWALPFNVELRGGGGNNHAIMNLLMPLVRIRNIEEDGAEQRLAAVIRWAWQYNINLRPIVMEPEGVGHIGISDICTPP